MQAALGIRHIEDLQPSHPLREPHGRSHTWREGGRLCRGCRQRHPDLRLERGSNSSGERECASGFCCASFAAQLELVVPCRRGLGHVVTRPPAAHQTLGTARAPCFPTGSPCGDNHDPPSLRYLTDEWLARPSVSRKVSSHATGWPPFRIPPSEPSVPLSTPRSRASQTQSSATPVEGASSKRARTSSAESSRHSAANWAGRRFQVSR